MNNEYEINLNTYNLVKIIIILSKSNNWTNTIRIHEELNKKLINI